MSWTPIADRTCVTEAVAAIAELLADPPPIYGGRRSDPALSLALFNRQPGFALFYAYLHAATGEPRWSAIVDDHIHTAMDAVPRALAEGRPFFAYGIAGLAWTLAHLDGWCLHGEVDALDDVDLMLEELVAANVVKSFALPKGLVGYGIYALERWPRVSARRLLQNVVERLVERARVRGSGVAWQLVVETAPPHVVAANPDGIWPRGALEGAAGAIALLEAAARLGVTCEGSDETIERGRAFALPVGAPKGMSWAGGDLGIAGVLTSSANDERALDVARTLATTTDAESCDEPGLLGGTAGTCMVFMRLAARTGDPTLRVAARTWLERTLALFEPRRDGGGFRFWQEPWQNQLVPELETGWVVDPGLFGGTAGVGLTLLAATTNIEPRWDRCLLLSTVMPP